MGKGNVSINRFNSGIVSPLALARTDIKHVQMAAETQTNFISKVLGAMMLRPGTQYITTAPYNSPHILYFPFIFSNSDTAIIELSLGGISVLVNEAYVGASESGVSTAITNGTFLTDLSGWTDADQSGATSSWQASNTGGGGYMKLVGTGSNYAMRKQTVTVASADQNKEHRVNISIGFIDGSDPYYAGSVTIRIGSTDGNDDYVAEESLPPGTYSFAFTPTGNFYIQLSSATQYAAAVNNIAISQGKMVLTPVVAGNGLVLSSFSSVRYDQSGDIVFIAAPGNVTDPIAQYRIIRFASGSWGISHYLTDDGPFRLQNTDNTLTIAASDLNGDVTLTASRSLFRSTHVGSLFSITSGGQTVTAALTAANTFSDSIRVTGIGANRAWKFTFTGVWTATVTVQWSTDNSTWVDYTGQNYTTNQTNVTFQDSWDNQTIYYRIGIKTGNYTSGTVNITMTYPFGGIEGRVRITSFTSSTSVTAAVLTSLGGTAATSTWAEGIWSTYRGWPGAVSFFEGRLWWAGHDQINGSVSDDFYSYDANTVGDSGPISRSIGSGPVDIINWLLPLLRLIIGGDGATHSCRSSAIDSPLTPTDFSIRSASSRGATAVPAVKMDLGGFFVNQTGSRLCELNIQNAYYSYDYDAIDRSLYCPELMAAGIARIAIQRVPETRVHCVLNDGTVAIFVIDPLEEVRAWYKYSPADFNGSSSQVVDAFVLPNPNSTEDKVYYVVTRGSSTYLERWALESECQGGSLNKNLDFHSTYSGSPISSFDPITYFPQLTGTYAVWADGIYYGTYSTGSGVLTLPTAVSNAVFGLLYTAQYKSSKLAYASQAGSALTEKKLITHLGLSLYNTQYQAIQYGRDFGSSLRDIPSVVTGQIVAADTVFSEKDIELTSLASDWDTDSRLCIQANGGRPVTLLCATIGIETTDE